MEEGIVDQGDFQKVEALVLMAVLLDIVLKIKSVAVLAQRHHQGEGEDPVVQSHKSIVQQEQYGGLLFCLAHA